MPRSAPSSLRTAIHRGFGGHSLVGRLRMVAFTMLGLTAAAALSIVAFVANQGWPEVGALVPGLPIERQAVSESAVVARPTLHDNPLVIAAVPPGSAAVAEGAGTAPVRGAQAGTGRGETGGSAAVPAPATAVAVAPSPQTRTPAAVPAAAPEPAPAATPVSSPAPSSPEAPASSAPATPAPTTNPSTPSAPGKGSEPPGKIVEVPGGEGEGVEEDEGSEEEAPAEEPGAGEEVEELPGRGWDHGGPSGPPWSEGSSGHGGWPGHGYGRSH